MAYSPHAPFPVLLILSEVQVGHVCTPRLSREAFRWHLLSIYHWTEHPCSQSTMFSFIAKCLSIYALSWLLWKALQMRFFSSALDNIPGPAPSSLLLGLLRCRKSGERKYLTLLKVRRRSCTIRMHGHSIKPLLRNVMWPSPLIGPPIDSTIDGRVIKLKGLLGVRFICLLAMQFLATNCEVLNNLNRETYSTSLIQRHCTIYWLRCSRAHCQSF